MASLGADSTEARATVHQLCYIKTICTVVMCGDRVVILPQHTPVDPVQSNRTREFKEVVQTYVSQGRNMGRVEY